jgi:hypothetical protein
MLTRIMDMPDNVLGISASGTVTVDDYQTVLIPALEEKLGRMKKLRLLYVLGDTFDTYTGAASWEDTKFGLKHFTHLSRIAVVTNVDWIRNSFKVFGFVLPGDTRVFKTDEEQAARKWISEPGETGKLTFEFLAEQGVLILNPHGELEAADFERIAAEIDPQIANKGTLKGVIICADHFPGWDDMSAMAAHFYFLRDHRKYFKRLAIVSDDRVMSMVPHLANHFIVKEARHFPKGSKSEAITWVSAG